MLLLVHMISCRHSLLLDSSFGRVSYRVLHDLSHRSRISTRSKTSTPNNCEGLPHDGKNGNSAAFDWGIEEAITHLSRESVARSQVINGYMHPIIRSVISPLRKCQTLRRLFPRDFLTRCLIREDEKGTLWLSPEVYLAFLERQKEAQLRLQNKLPPHSRRKHNINPATVGHGSYFFTHPDVLSKLHYSTRETKKMFSKPVHFISDLLYVTREALLQECLKDLRQSIRSRAITIGLGQVEQKLASADESKPAQPDDIMLCFFTKKHDRTHEITPDILDQQQRIVQHCKRLGVAMLPSTIFDEELMRAELLPGYNKRKRYAHDGSAPNADAPQPPITSVDCIALSGKNKAAYILYAKGKQLELLMS